MAEDTDSEYYARLKDLKKLSLNEIKNMSDLSPSQIITLQNRIRGVSNKKDKSFMNYMRDYNKEKRKKKSIIQRIRKFIFPKKNKSNKNMSLVVLEYGRHKKYRKSFFI